MKKILFSKFHVFHVCVTEYVICVLISYIFFLSFSPLPHHLLCLLLFVLLLLSLLLLFLSLILLHFCLLLLLPFPFLLLLLLLRRRRRRIHYFYAEEIFIHFIIPLNTVWVNLWTKPSESYTLHNYLISFEFPFS